MLMKIGVGHCRLKRQMSWPALPYFVRGYRLQENGHEEKEIKGPFRDVPHGTDCMQPGG